MGRCREVTVVSDFSMNNKKQEGEKEGTKVGLGQTWQRDFVHTNTALTCFYAAAGSGCFSSSRAKSNSLLFVL